MITFTGCQTIVMLSPEAYETRWGQDFLKHQRIIGYLSTITGILTSVALFALALDLSEN